MSIAHNSLSLDVNTKDPFRIRDHVSDFDVIVADIVENSEAARKHIGMIADVAYGPGPSESADLFFPEGARHKLPVHIFIHGGYWRMFSKRDFSCVAETVTGAGAIAVILDYSLMPAVRMATIVDQVRRAKQWLMDNIARYGGDADQMTVSGHSAGAHLSTFLLNTPKSRRAVKSAFLLGGLYDLKPLQNSFLASEIGITDEEVEAFSPITQSFDNAVDIALLVGSDETPPFHDQAKTFSSHLHAQGVKVSSSVIADTNHMGSVRDLGVPGTEAASLLAGLITRSMADTPA